MDADLLHRCCTQVNLLHCTLQLDLAGQSHRDALPLDDDFIIFITCQAAIAMMMRAVDAADPAAPCRVMSCGGVVIWQWCHDLHNMPGSH